MVNIYDVAAHAGVSIKTVSRVMNGEPGVRAEMRARVKASAEALSYHPSLSARSLAGSRSFIIAVIADAGLTLDHWRNGRGMDYLTRIQLGATVLCREAGYHLLIELHDHSTRQGLLAIDTMLATLRPDGVILTPPSVDSEKVLAILRRRSVKFARLGAERSTGGGLMLPFDDRGAAHAMAEHLLSLGHRRIGLIEGDRRFASSRARSEGFHAALAAHGLVTPWRGEGDYTYQSGVACAHAILRQSIRPTAIFASNDEMALGCIAAANELGLSVPHHISVAGFDDAAAAQVSHPTLTTLRQPIMEAAAQATSALITGKAEVTAFGLYTVVLRQSTAPPFG